MARDVLWCTRQRLQVLCRNSKVAGLKEQRMPLAVLPLLVLTAAVCLPLIGSALPLASLDPESLPGWKGEGIGTSDEDWHGEIVHLAWEPRAFLLKRFLSKEECEHLIMLAKPSMGPSVIIDNKTGKSVVSPIRTSTSTFLYTAQDSTVSRIEERVASVTMTPVEHQEHLQILHYKDGEKYLEHFDYFRDPLHLTSDGGGQRLATVLMYLMTPEEGGETVFPNAARKASNGEGFSECAQHGMPVRAVQGDAVLFFSLHPDGTVDKTSLHGSCPTTKGEKWTATKWIHTNPRHPSLKEVLIGPPWGVGFSFGWRYSVINEQYYKHILLQHQINVWTVQEPRGIAHKTHVRQHVPSDET